MAIPEPDPFHTAAVRSAVLDAWGDAHTGAARFREDANAEEDLVRGGYRDRVLVELAQNAADAATAAGVPGRLVLTLAGGVLRAANTGAPLTADGVLALSTLRASAKREEAAEHAAVGRFGVGFAAVLAVTDEPSIVSREGGVAWSAARTRETVLGVPAVAAELQRRAGAVPVLRLPWALDAPAPEGDLATEVRLPLRDGAAEDEVRRLLDLVDPTLLLTLPGLAEVEVDVDGRVRVLRAERGESGATIRETLDGSDQVSRWRLAGRSGTHPPELLADRPVEERSRPGWAATWALPVREDETPLPLPPTVPAVVHAPTPTDEPLSLPAVLVATMPLDPSRRHVAEGRLRDAMVAAAAAAYVDLLAGLPRTVPELVPTGLAAGALDGAVRAAVVAACRPAPVLPGRHGGRLRPEDAQVFDRLGPAASALLGDVLPGLLETRWQERSAAAALEVLGVRRRPLADLCDLLAEVRRPDEWWGRLYAALHADGAPADPAGREALAGLPVPLADGRLVQGPRGLLLLDGAGAPAAALARWGVRCVAAAAAHPVLLELGALESSPRTLLEDPALLAAVRASVDLAADDAEAADELADAVLTLVRRSAAAPGDVSELAELALPGADGEWWPAGELLFPDGPLASVVVEDSPFGVVADAARERWGDEALEAAGVLRTFALATARDVTAAADGAALDLDGEEDWLESCRAGADLPGVLPELVAVRDLELVGDWPAALRMLAEPGPLRDAVLAPVVVLEADGRSRRVPSYTAWWLRRERIVTGRLAGSDPLLTGLYDEVHLPGLPADLLRVLGAVGELADADPDELLQRLADPGRQVARGQLRAIYATLVGDRAPGAAPERLRAVRGDELAVLDADRCVVVDRPDLLPLLGDRGVLPAPLEGAVDVADALAVPLASELGEFEIRSAGRPMPVPAPARALLGQAPGVVTVHDRLLVADADGAERAVPWRVAGDEVHVGGGPGGPDPSALARGLAWYAGAWRRRHEVASLLSGVTDLATLVSERDLG